MDEGHEPNRVQANRLPRRRNPLDLSTQYAGAEVEHPLVPPQLAVADVEGLVVDE
jgi:hypothetical protein